MIGSPFLGPVLHAAIVSPWFVVWTFCSAAACFVALTVLIWRAPPRR